MIEFEFENKEKYNMSENESFARWQYIFRVLVHTYVMREEKGMAALCDN